MLLQFSRRHARVAGDARLGAKQKNEIAAYTLLAMLDLRPDVPWAEAQAPLRGITPIIDFIRDAYDIRYAPNTRETIRDDAVKFFVELGCCCVIPMTQTVRRIAARPSIK